jgi:peptidoglycan/xylan/chitin deacetylase (PgdA/CDA1 family)
MLKMFLSSLNWLISLPTLVRLTGMDVFLPFYHCVSDQNHPYIRHVLRIISVKEFEEQIDYILRFFTPVDLETVISKKVRLNKKPVVHISFDDGLREVYTIIRPILLRKGIPATFFLNTGFIDNRDMFFRFKTSLLYDVIMQKMHVNTLHHALKKIFSEHDKQFKEPKDILKLGYQDKIIINLVASALQVDFQSFLDEQQPYMTLEQVKTMKQEGFTIGAHSIDHPEYRFISTEQQIFQTRESCWFLSEYLDISNCYFSFPFTDYGVSARFFNIAKKFLSASFGCAGIKIDNMPHHYQRLAMDRNNLNASEHIKTEYLSFLLKKFVNKHIVTHKP